MTIIGARTTAAFACWFLALLKPAAFLLTCASPVAAAIFNRAALSIIARVGIICEHAPHLRAAAICRAGIPVIADQRSSLDALTGLHIAAFLTVTDVLIAAIGVLETSGLHFHPALRRAAVAGGSVAVVAFFTHLCPAVAADGGFDPALHRATVA